MLNNRFDVSKMGSSKEALRVIIGKGKERFSTDRVEATDRMDIRKNVSMREPSISKKNDMIISIKEEVRTKGDTRFNEFKRVGIRIMSTFEATKPNRDAVAYQYEERIRG